MKMINMFSASMMMNVISFLVLVCLSPCHQALFWRPTNKNRNVSIVNLSRSSSYFSGDISLKEHLNEQFPSSLLKQRLLLTQRGGGDGSSSIGGKDDVDLICEANTSGFGPNVMMGGFLSHVYVLSKKTTVDDIIEFLNKFLPSKSKKQTIIFSKLPGQDYDLTGINDDRASTTSTNNSDEDNNGNGNNGEDTGGAKYRQVLPIMNAMASMFKQPLHICCTDDRGDYVKLISMRFVDDDDVGPTLIYCVTVLDSFTDDDKKNNKEHELLNEMKELLDSNLGYVGHMLSPPPFTTNDIIEQAKKYDSQEGSKGNHLNQKKGYFAGEELTVEEWITILRETGAKMVSKPELEKFVFLGGIGNGLPFDAPDGHSYEEFEVTPESLKTFFQGELWEYPNWEFRATRDYLLVQFGKNKGAVFQWEESLDMINPESFVTDSERGVVNVIENDNEAFFIST